MVLLLLKSLKSSAFKPLHCILIFVELLCLSPSESFSEELFDVSNFPVIVSKDLDASVELSGLLDVEGHYIDRRPPGLIFGDDKIFFVPRLALFLDAQVGEDWYAFVQGRIDRGFHPLSMQFDARIDEFFVRYDLPSTEVVSVQLGKFATVMGGWINRHDVWQNPFLNAPLVYENVTILSDRTIPNDPQEFLSRKDVPDRKRDWVPIIWGPTYTSGAALLLDGTAASLHLEVKNGAPSSRPYDWERDALHMESPTIAGRLGYRHSAGFSHGISSSYGSYLQDKEGQVFPDGSSRSDYEQFLIGYDALYEYRRLSLAIEGWYTEFQVPNVGIADSTGYFVESRYRVSPLFFAALRWNQQLFGEVNDESGDSRRWDDDAYRLDAALGFQPERTLLIKLQYSFFEQQGTLQQGQNYVGLQGVYKF